ncbi:hypothetical protein Mapa_013365 [Marchantia paleacea]|nr:hypothetical protein Mapa_013365 [Marchantia paleacea]
MKSRVCGWFLKRGLLRLRAVRDVPLASSNYCEPGQFIFFVEVGGRRRRKKYIHFEVDEARLCISSGP